FVSHNLIFHAMFGLKAVLKRRLEHLVGLLAIPIITDPLRISGVFATIMLISKLSPRALIQFNAAEIFKVF
ncbi:MAG: hypothetical protein R6V56_04915, partial [Lentisphaeria bacterium]